MKSPPWKDQKEGRSAKGVVHIYTEREQPMVTILSPESITQRGIEMEPLEDEKFLEVQDQDTGEMTKYPITVLTPSQLVREHHLLPPVPETGQPLPSIPLEKLPPELQKVYQDIKFR